MPIYEYACAACLHIHEVIQKMTDAPLTICPKCQQATLRKQVSATAFRLKGDGWYETDFKKTGQRNLVSSDTAPAAESSAPAASSESSQQTPPSSSATKAN
jgi:putative FmdB family regulatory protein